MTMRALFFSLRPFVTRHTVVMSPTLIIPTHSPSFLHYPYYSRGPYGRRNLVTSFDNESWKKTLRFSTTSRDLRTVLPLLFFPWEREMIWVESLIGERNRMVDSPLKRWDNDCRSPCLRSNSLLAVYHLLTKRQLIDHRLKIVNLVTEIQEAEIQPLDRWRIAIETERKMGVDKVETR